MSTITATLSSRSLVSTPTSEFVKSSPLYNMLLSDNPINFAEQSKTTLIFQACVDGTPHGEVYTTRHLPQDSSEPRELYVQTLGKQFPHEDFVVVTQLGIIFQPFPQPTNPRQGL